MADLTTAACNCFQGFVSITRGVWDREFEESTVVHVSGRRCREVLGLDHQVRSTMTADTVLCSACAGAAQ